MTNPNEPAFLKETVNIDGSPQNNGLTKREYFAAMAMQGLSGNTSIQRACDKIATRKGTDIPEELCKCALDLADSLIAELNKK